MSLPTPDLYDRTWSQLVDEAVQRTRRSCPTWTDRSPGDPGMVLLEAFAHLAHAMIYRFNRLPEKAYVEFLRLIGVHLRPPGAATATLLFERDGDGGAIDLPRGTRVTLERRDSGDGPAPVFHTIEDLHLEPAQESAQVLAIHGEPVAGELAGTGTGAPGLSVVVCHPPITAPVPGDPDDLAVRVELTDEDGPVPADQVHEHAGRRYRTWRRVEHFSDAVADDEPVFVVDRAAGRITFGPGVEGRRPSRDVRALGAVPGAGRAIRVWYRRGGGPAGNVRAGALTVLKPTVPGLRVTNPAPSQGGYSTETLENALRRGPVELRSLHRTVTATDYELVACETGAANRARAHAAREQWCHAEPGTVQVLLVPALPGDHRPGDLVSAARLRELQTGEARRRVLLSLQPRTPLGTRCEVGWVRYKTVQVAARVVVRAGHDAEALGRRVRERLHRTLSPFRLSADQPGWPFGRTLHASHVYDLCQADPGVSFVDSVELRVPEEPRGAIPALARDPFQRRTWYAASGDTVFRSLDDGEGWEPATFAAEPGETVAHIALHPAVPGKIAAVSRGTDDEGGTDCRLHVSRDCGETWRNPRNYAGEVRGLAWMRREDTDLLVLATDRGLFEVADTESPDLDLVASNPGGAPLPLYAVAVSPDFRCVALAATEKAGVFLSTEEGRDGTFRALGARGADVRTLAFQAIGARTWLWAGTTPFAEEPGEGCLRWELGVRADGGTPFATGWAFGRCTALAFSGTTVLAATGRSGMVRIDAGASSPTWESVPPSTSGLPGSGERHDPLLAIALSPDGRVMVSGPDGIFRRAPDAARFERCSSGGFPEKVSLPDTWLLCSGEHDIRVVPEVPQPTDSAEIP